jgi:hypothetical protein
MGVSIGVNESELDEHYQTFDRSHLTSEIGGNKGSQGSMEAYIYVNKKINEPLSPRTRLHINEPLSPRTQLELMGHGGSKRSSIDFL